MTPVERPVGRGFTPPLRSVDRKTWRGGPLLYGLILAIALNFVLGASSLSADETVRNVYEVCADLGENEKNVVDKLTDLGWQRGSQEINRDLLFWAVFSRDFARFDDESLRRQGNSEKLGNGLGYLIVNSDFMSASILGNSALPQGQPSFVQAPYHLAVLGVSLGKGYCVLSGPSSAAEDILNLSGFTANWPERFPKSNRPGVDAVYGEADQSSIFVAKFDQAELISLFSSMEIVLPYSSDEFDIGMFNNVPGVVIHISPKEPQ